MELSCWVLTLPRKILLCPINWMDIGNKLKWIICTHCNWKNKNSGGHFGATSQTALPIHIQNEPNGLNWQCCLAGNSTMVTTILFFSIAMSADYSFELISIVHWVPQFFMRNKSILGGVYSVAILDLYYYLG